MVQNIYKTKYAQFTFLCKQISCMKKVLWTLVYGLLVFNAFSVEHERLPADSFPKKSAPRNGHWIAPVILFTTGANIAAIPSLRRLDTAVYNVFKVPRNHTRLDDYTQYLPGLAVFAMDAAGMKGIHRPQHQLLLYGLSNVSAGVVVQSMKRIVQRERPYGNEFKSFPSGHTSTAFVAAEFLHQEYGHLSPWISVAGYATAAATGYMRLYNDQHWLSDVLAGAALGMASTKMIYWIKKKRDKRSRLNKNQLSYVVRAGY